MGLKKLEKTFNQQIDRMQQILERSKAQKDQLLFEKTLASIHSVRECKQRIFAAPAPKKAKDE